MDLVHFVCGGSLRSRVHQDHKSKTQMEAEQVAQAVLQAFALLPQRFKPKPTEWTILAGIVAFDSTKQEYFIVSMGTGTKCNGFPDSPIDPWSIRDCHAETICRRGLLLVLWKDLIKLQNGEDTVLLSTCAEIKEEDLLVKRTKHDLTRCNLKPNLTLHLFISDLPCGSASEFQRVQGASMRETGAKPLGNNGLCTKPGRSDLPENKKTRCMSCSDKVMKWCSFCGIQGTLLMRAGLTSTIRLSSVVLSRDAALSALENPLIQPTAEEENKAKQAVISSMKQCLLRVSGNDTCPVFVCSAGFPQSRQQVCPPQRLNSTKGSPSGACMSLVCTPNGKRMAVNKNTGYVEMLVGMRGVKEGASKTAPSQAVHSDLCKANLFLLFMQCCYSSEPNTSYLDAKLGSHEYAQLREDFLAMFPEWNVNRTWDKFIL